MKTLFLIRHAKSSRDDPALSDRERPLDERGERDVVRMGKRLAERQVKPDAIVASPATRALATAAAIAESLEYRRRDIRVDERLYGGRADDLLAVIRGLDDPLGQVMLVGHNPEMSELAHAFADDIDALPTCAVVEFDFDVKFWSAIGEAPPLRVALDYPKKAG